VICPFGIVIAGTDRYPESNMHYTANVIAAYLDRTNDGSVDIKNIRMYMSGHGPDAIIFGGGASRYDEQACDSITGSYWNCIKMKIYQPNSSRRLLSDNEN